MSLQRALVPRSVHIRIIPRPANLSESREIYRVLQKFGEINVFKYLRVSSLLPGWLVTARRVVTLRTSGT